MSGLTTIHRRLASHFEMSEGSRASRNLPMEGLRGLAVILVFFVHYHALFSPWMRPDSAVFSVSFFLSSIGHSGVDLFFVLSGYLIYGAVVRKSKSYVEFIKRRVERIYPTFLCVLCVYLLLSVLFPSKSKIPAGTASAAVYIVENILLLPGIFNVEPIITVAWSLSYEFFYYLTIPLVVAWAGMRRWAAARRALFFGALALLYTGYCLFAGGGHPRLVMFVSGILLYEAMHSFGLGKRMTVRDDYLVLASMLAVFFLIYLCSDWQAALPAPLRAERFGGFYRLGLLFAGFYLFTLACFNSRGPLKTLFSWTPLRWLGNMSYSYYLIHGLTLQGVRLLMDKIAPPTDQTLSIFFVGLPIFFSLTLVTSAFLFILVEKRFSLVPVSPKLTGAHALGGVAPVPDRSSAVPE